MNHVEEEYDVLIVGAGHAGCEAALAAARLGLETIVFTVSVDSIAMMPCNPNIGGSSKGHLVREIDALGGEMGKNIDKTFLQSKMLNVSKGPAVHSLRAQADKQAYTREMRRTLENTGHLTIRQGEISEIIVENGRLTGAKTVSGAIYHVKSMVIATGTYLKARCIYGDVSNETGPNGLQSAKHLTKSLEEHSIELRRFKTGTPARVDRRSLDFSKMEIQEGDERIVPFSFSTDPDSVQKEQVPCWLTYTNEETHRIIRENIDRSPLFSGAIEGTGPRYCPSIEDKVVKFADKERHHVFVEPEGLYTNEMYLSGMSSSLPEDVQYAMYRTVPGLEHVKIVRNAYAIEYDCIDARQLKPTLEFKSIAGLFAAGQFNGSSGYEEAAAQGIIAGINAARNARGLEGIVIDRSQGYIGVLIDDLVTKESHEPYRMMTSRAEYRLLLRQDNADLRLSEIGHEVGLVSDEAYQKVQRKEEMIESEIRRLKGVMVGASEKVQSFLTEHGSAPLKTAASLEELIRRPELDYEAVAPLDPARNSEGRLEDFFESERSDISSDSEIFEGENKAESCSEREPDESKKGASACFVGMDGEGNHGLYDIRKISQEIVEQINIHIKYEGYIERQKRQVEQFQKLEKKKLPKDINYANISGLRIEARQKLTQYQPVSIGQASRISGVSPADISVLLVYLETKTRKDTK